jgi:hypothetical protein
MFFGARILLSASRKRPQLPFFVGRSSLARKYLLSTDATNRERPKTPYNGGDCFPSAP